MTDKKKIVIVDGGPRKTWNTAQMLDAVAEGALSGAGGTRGTGQTVPPGVGQFAPSPADPRATASPTGDGSANVEIMRFRLYDLDFKGCVSCFACKRKGVQLKRCALNDGLAPLLEAVADCDGLVLGSPIYLGDMTGLARAFVERACFPYISYDRQPHDQQPLNFGRIIRTGFVYTTNAPEFAYEEIGYWDLFRRNEELFARIFGQSSWVVASETLQFDNYDAYASGMFDVAQRLERRETVFPQDLQRAFELGASLVL